MRKKPTANYSIDLNEIKIKYDNLTKREKDFVKKIYEKLLLDEEKNENLDISCTSHQLCYLMIEILRNY